MIWNWVYVFTNRFIAAFVFEKRRERFVESFKSFFSIESNNDSSLIKCNEVAFKILQGNKIFWEKLDLVDEIKDQNPYDPFDQAAKTMSIKKNSNIVSHIISMKKNIFKMWRKMNPK